LLIVAAVAVAVRLVTAVLLVSARPVVPYWKIYVPVSPSVLTIALNVAVVVAMDVAGEANTEGEPATMYLADATALLATLAPVAMALMVTVPVTWMGAAYNGELIVGAVPSTV
jgi:hypothetical protein